MHHPSRRTLILIAALALITACASPESQTDLSIETLVTPEWLSQHLDDPDLVVLDCTVLVEPDGSGGFRLVSGRADYDSGHIPSAGFADLMGDLSDGDLLAVILGDSWPDTEAVARIAGSGEALGTLIWTAGGATLAEYAHS